VVQGFAGQCSQTKPFQLVFPHHRQALIKAQQSQVFTQQPMLLWNSVMGPVMGYVGDTMFLQNSTRGIMPMPAQRGDRRGFSRWTASNSTPTIA
jgi:endoglucanase Acf2